MAPKTVIPTQAQVAKVEVKAATETAEQVAQEPETVAQEGEATIPMFSTTHLISP